MEGGKKRGREEGRDGGREGWIEGGKKGGMGSVSERKKGEERISYDI